MAYWCNTVGAAALLLPPRRLHISCSALPRAAPPLSLFSVNSVSLVRGIARNHSPCGVLPAPTSLSPDPPRRPPATPPTLRPAAPPP
ncbi:hypothetical protein E2C01_012389 [Portunus trituberculatus]|uniref:Uncharacterized protein n=1 Tax=Portunus trituberculatus TaxID=210409 RepID=A0A5B7DDY9_PORTR|nr:hypothetical protein [Portunus trituberculatus]